MPYIALKTPEGTSEMIEWSPYEKPKAKFRFKRSKSSAETTNVYSIDEEAIHILKEWYATHNLQGPSKEEIDACRGSDALMETAHQEQMAAPLPSTKPAYGTPEFWKDWWRKKKAKEAEQAQALLAKAQADFAALNIKEV